MADSGDGSPSERQIKLDRDPEVTGELTVDEIDKALAAEQTVTDSDPNGASARSTAANGDTAGDTNSSNDASSSNGSNTSDTNDSSDSSESSDSSDSSDNDHEHAPRTPLKNEDDDDDNEVPHTRNEVIEVEIPQLPPGFEMTDTTAIDHAGTIVRVGDRAIVIKAAASGKYRIFDEGTVFCLRDRKVIGVLYETFGPVEAPFYVVRFASDSDLDDFKSAQGAEACYVVPASHFVLTETLKTKGSDASNFHDEEIPLEDQEFSDDEQEALAKSSRKRKRKAPNANADPSKQRPRIDGSSGSGPNVTPSSGYLQSVPQTFQQPQQRSNQLQGQQQQQQQQQQQPRQNAGMLAAWYAYAQQFFGGQSAPPPY